MPRKDGTGPDGKGPKTPNQGVPTPRRNKIGRGTGTNTTPGARRGAGEGRGGGRSRGNR